MKKFFLSALCALIFLGFAGSDIVAAASTASAGVGSSAKKLTNDELKVLYSDKEKVKELQQEVADLMKSSDKKTYGKPIYRAILYPKVAEAVWGGHFGPFYAKRPRGLTCNA